MAFPAQRFPAPAVLYSRKFVSGFHVDGACYVNPVRVTEAGDESDLFRDQFTIGGCGDEVCGPRSLYKYTQVFDGITEILVVQPTGLAAPFVSLRSAPGLCYEDPVFESVYPPLSTPSLPVYVPAQIFAFATDFFCGDLWFYAPCNGLGDGIIVVYPYGDPTDSVVVYAGRCYSLAGPSTDIEQWTSVLRSTITAASGCADPACTNESLTGTAVKYTSLTAGEDDVKVRFDGLGLGIPYFGVSPRTINTGRNGLTPDEALIEIRQPSAIFLRAAGGDGILEVTVRPTTFLRKVYKKHLGVTTVTEMKPGTDAVQVSVQLGDEVGIRIDEVPNVVPGTLKGKPVHVSWSPYSPVPRLYQTVPFSGTGTAVITAVGFCGLTSRQPYTLFSSLPADAEQITESVNPDSVMTVASGGAEYVLVKARADGDPSVIIPPSTSPYSGQTLAYPMTFKFYASRYLQGSHGELDVWTNGTGTFPSYFSLSPYRKIVLTGTGTRYNSAVNDVRRNDVVVAVDGTANLPFVYVSDTGRQLVVHVVPPPGTVTYQSEVFTRRDPAPGLAAVILGPSDVGL